MRIIHFSDLHFGCKLESKSYYFNKSLLGYLNYRFKRQDSHNYALLPKFIDKVKSNPPDLLVCTGDLTCIGQPKEFEIALNALEPLLDLKIPIAYVPGNHDLYVRNEDNLVSLIKTFNTLNQQLGINYSQLPASFTINDNLFIMVNECTPTSPASSCGYLSKKSSEYIVKKVIDNPNKKIILIGHYPVIEPFSITRLRRRLWGQGKIRDLLDNKKINLSLIGHIHEPYLSLNKTGEGEICAGSLTKAASYNDIILNNDCNIINTTYLT
jgi:3',5'-cyclic AMP phosphodiesterase CpdA